MNTVIKTVCGAGFAAACLGLAACGEDESDVVVIDRTEDSEPDGDSFSFSVGDDGVRISSENTERDGGTNRVTVGEDGVSVESREPD